MAAYAGFDVLRSILQQLRDPFRVSEELAGHADGINFSIRNGLGTNFGIHSPGAYHRNIHKLLDVCNIGKITVLRHVHGRMRPVPRIVGAVVSVEHVISCVLKILCCPLGLLHIPPDLGVIFTRHGTVAESLHLGLYGITQRYRVILPAGFFDSFNNLRGKAIAIFKVTAIFIRALVEKLDSKLIQKIPFVNRVYFHAVHTSIFAELCRFRKRFNDFMNLSHCDFRAFDIVCPARRLRRRRRQLMGCVKHRFHKFARNRVLVQWDNGIRDSPGSTHTGSELNKELCSGFVNLIHENGKILKHLWILPKPFTPKGISQRGNAGNNQPYVIIRSFQE